jgi:hypothetical protein
LKPFYIFFLVTLLILSCNKEETPVAENPDWLEIQIQELETNEQHCWDCEITRYTYNNEYYYNIYCGYWSCIFCKLYNSNGQLTSEIEEFDFEEFHSSYDNETVIWSCQNSE